MKKFDYIAKPVVSFVLRVLGAFGACWGVFSSVDVTRRQFFSYTGEDTLMNNKLYARSALTIAISMAALSGYLLLRESCPKNNIIHSEEGSMETDAKVEEVQINISSSSNILLTQKKKVQDQKIIQIYSNPRSTEIDLNL